MPGSKNITTNGRFYVAAASFNGIPDAPVIALAHLVLKRAKLKLPCTMRTQAVAILLGVKPAPAKDSPFTVTQSVPQHGTCPRKLAALYSEAVNQINGR